MNNWIRLCLHVDFLLIWIPLLLFPVVNNEWFQFWGLIFNFAADVMHVILNGVYSLSSLLPVLPRKQTNTNITFQHNRFNALPVSLLPCEEVLPHWGVGAKSGKLWKFVSNFMKNALCFGLVSNLPHPLFLVLQFQSHALFPEHFLPSPLNNISEWAHVRIQRENVGKIHREQVGVLMAFPTCDNSGTKMST